MEALEGLVSIRIGCPGKRFGVAEGGLLCLGVQVSHHAVSVSIFARGIPASRAAS